MTLCQGVTKGSTMWKYACFGAVLLGLAACSGGRTLHQLDEGLIGPDEFRVLPTLPLAMPETLALPVPTPGGTNRTDRNPNAEAIAALGGQPSAAFAGGIPTRDAALVSAAGRNGVDPAIRQTLATEDAAFRQRSLTLSPFGGDRYFRAYARQALDAYAELERFRALGIAVPTAPPLE
jgi:hypothetical protein